ncbi:hypothetical protein D918_08837 [Trichuris suis]|nr:hypothetical protein D918_08837 [Trichuris suis]
MTLLQSNENSATGDLWKVVDEVAAFYQREGVTEYWISPVEEEANTFQGPIWYSSCSRSLYFLAHVRYTDDIIWKRPDESASNVAQRVLGSESQEKNVMTVDSESNNSADFSKRKRPSKLTVAGFQGKKSLGNDLLPPTGRIGQEGIACVVCKKLGFTNGNSVIECQECHDMYHQKCHTPNISQNQVDPRSVWYCTKCSKLMRKIAAKAQATTPPSVSVPEKLSAIGKNPPSLKSPAADNPLGKMFSRFEATGAFGVSKSS